MNAREQKELYRLLEKQILTFTNGESELESVEIAQQLLMSMEYCMNSYYKGLENSEPYGLDKIKKQHANGTEHMEDIFEKGVVAVKGCVQKSKELWIKVKNSMVNVDNNSYKTTILTELPQFFCDYNPRYKAHIIPVEIQYALALEIEELTGVEYIYEYLFHLLLENEFIGKFDIAYVQSLVLEYTKETNDDSVNLYEIVLQNVLGLKLLNRDIKTLYISKEDREELCLKLDGLSIARVQIWCEEQSREVLSDLNLTSQDMITYTIEKVKEISTRLVQSVKQRNLEYLFVSFGESKNEETTYFEGITLLDEKLREVIDEMCQMRYLKDKLQILKEKVHSLTDLKEVLSECFAGEEYTQVFQLLLPSEKALLISQAKANLAFYGDETLLQEWEHMLLESEEDA